MTVPAKVLVPVTVKLELPVLLTMLAPVPPIVSEPTVTPVCKSKVALVAPDIVLIDSEFAELPRVPEPLTTKVPALMVVPPV